jgi:hypothetical protein
MALTLFVLVALAMTRPWLRGGQRPEAPGGNVDFGSLLMEDGFYLLLEDGGQILLES